MKKLFTILVFYIFLLWITPLFSQKELLIIGRTTGMLFLNKKKSIRTFGFTNSLSGQVTLPGHIISAKVGDSVHLDFWNISQGNPVSLHCKEIDFLQRDSNHEIMIKKEPVHHMEHGYYSFLAKKSGTYLYYSPENYPFNVQAGMFGLIIISEPKIETSTVELIEETLWCSHEIDTKWHTDALMGTEYDPNNNPIRIPEFMPNYFCINGESITKVKGLCSKASINKTILLRLANAGLYEHIIQFPLEAILQVKFTTDSNSKNKVIENKVAIGSGECIELLVSLTEVTNNAQITYQFTDPITKKNFFKAAIPVFYN